MVKAQCKGEVQLKGKQRLPGKLLVIVLSTLPQSRITGCSKVGRAGRV